jgi:putative addiction module antidote
MASAGLLGEVPKLKFQGFRFRVENSGEVANQRNDSVELPSSNGVAGAKNAQAGVPVPVGWTHPSAVATIVITGDEPMLELKVRKIGNSLGVVLPKEAVSRLKADEGDRLFLIEGAEGAYQLTAYDPAFEKKMKKAEDIVRRYRNTLHVLAK